MNKLTTDITIGHTISKSISRSGDIEIKQVSEIIYYLNNKVINKQQYEYIINNLLGKEQ